MSPKPFSHLTESDFKQFPIWEFITESDEVGELLAEPIEDLPVTHMANRIVATQLELANGDKCFGFLSNVCLKNNITNQHFVQPTFLINKKWFPLSRYFDLDYEHNGPSQLVEMLEKTMEDVFPIKYDISNVAVEGCGDSSVLRGEIAAVTKYRLSKSEIIKMAIIVGNEAL